LASGGKKTNLPVYRPQKPSARAVSIRLLVRRVTGGKVTPLIAHLVNDRPLTSEGVSQIRDLIAKAEARAKRKSQ
jgi:hypothetical protein